MDSISKMTAQVSGKQLCDMNQEELTGFLEVIAHRGAMTALAKVGLHDEDAVYDVRDLRDMLRGIRVFRKSAMQQVGREVVRCGRMLVVFGILYLVYNSRTTTAAVQAILPSLPTP